MNSRQQSSPDTVIIEQVKVKEGPKNKIYCVVPRSFHIFGAILVVLDLQTAGISPSVLLKIDFYNYKEWYSCVLLGVCNADNVSPIFILELQENPIFLLFSDMVIFSENCMIKRIRCFSSLLNGVLVTLHLIKDTAFPLLETLMKPFPHAVQDVAHRMFNYRLSRTRRVTENAFARLKARLRIILKRMELDVASVSETASAFA